MPFGLLNSEEHFHFQYPIISKTHSMKRIILFGLLIFTFSFQAQNKTSGLVLLDSNMSAKLDLDNQNSKVYLTLSGPSDRWFALGFNSTIMAANVDCVVMTSDTNVTDSHFPGGYFAPLADVENNWILTDNSVSNSIRTIKAYRNFVSSDASDFTFSNTLNSLDVIWAYSYNPIYELYDPVNSGHGSDNYGHVTLFFSDLSTNQSTTSSYVLTMFPNPVKDELTIIPNNINSSEVEIKIYNFNYQIIFSKIFSISKSKELKIPFTNLPNGIYFIKSKIDTFESIKKIIVKK